MKAQLIKVEKLSDEIKTFWFEPEQKLDYIAGQYIELKLPHDSPDDRGEKRWFTLSSSPTDKLLSITTRFSSPSSSFKAKLQNLEIGYQFNISQAMGDFVLPMDDKRQLIYVAGGIGITPIHSMVKWLSDNSEKRSIKLLWAVNQESDLIFDKLFKSYSMEYVPVVTNPGPDWKGEVGHISPERILNFCGAAELNELIYLSGPEPMIESFTKTLSKPIDPGRLVSDYFPGYTKI